MPRAQSNGIELEYEVFGADDAPPLLLVMGFSAQMIHWDDAFVERLVDAGFRVIRFDNRDVGLSTHLENAPAPNIGAAIGGDTSSAAYTLSDMAADAVGLLDHLGIAAAHIVGASMGGMIVQLMAIEHPTRVLSLCSIMSTTGAPHVGAPSQEAMSALLAPPPTNREEAMESGVAAEAVIGSSVYRMDPDLVRQRAARSWDRSHDPIGVARQLVAILATPDRTVRLALLDVPTLVLHGSADPLINVSGGEATAKAIPGADLVVLDGMAHDLPEPLWPEIVDHIVANTRKAD